MSSQYSDVRLYIRPIDRDVQRADIEDLFKGYGKLLEIKLMQGFGFIEFENPRDAKDAVDEFNGKDFMGSRLLLEFARVQRRRDDFRERDPRDRRDRDSFSRGRDSRDRDPRDRRPRRSGYRLAVTGLPPDCSWQDLKDFARLADVDILFTDVARSRDGTGVIELERSYDIETAIKRLDGETVKGASVSVKEDATGGFDRERSRSPYRRASPPARRPYYGSGGSGYRDDEYRSRDRSRSRSRSRSPVRARSRTRSPTPVRSRTRSRSRTPRSPVRDAASEPAPVEPAAPAEPAEPAAAEPPAEPAAAEPAPPAEPAASADN
ncbi:uncharacterized protein V1510DRAFT_279918 [Dipodascopsis tothii]|uniref:uncharacterized protein n=1 Tax=Dipodascopsis tothii TaxID=44089 RepID=UPI0034CDDFFF